MSHFYGIVSGQAQTEATRRGSKNGGLSTVAASWQGCVRVQLYEDNGVDMCRVYLAPWHGRGTDKLLYAGPVGGQRDGEPATGTAAEVDIHTATPEQIEQAVTQIMQDQWQ